MSATQVKTRQTGNFFKAPRSFCKRDVKGFPIGKRTERRAKENKELRKLKISRCEIRIRDVCVDRIMLTWAHSKKSRYLVTSKDWQEAARCCLPCHQQIEAMPHKRMMAVILNAIARRKP